MKARASTEPGSAGFPATLPAGSSRFVWVLAGASVAVIVLLYVFVFRAAREVQIREVPLATKGVRP